MNIFPNVSFDRSDEYRAFILKHESAVKTEKAAWIREAEAGKKVIPYCQSYPEDEPERDPLIYFEFVDSDLNSYVDFFDRNTEQWVESYHYTDKHHSWTIKVDNWAYGDPLGLGFDDDTQTEVGE